MISLTVVPEDYTLVSWVRVATRLVVLWPILRLAVGFSPPRPRTGTEFTAEAGITNSTLGVS